MSRSPDAQLESIAAAIERYLALNPSAADSVVGIAQWWLPTVGGDAPPEAVEQALLLLRARGVVQDMRVGDRHIWRAASGSSKA